MAMDEIAPQIALLRQMYMELGQEVPPDPPAPAGRLEPVSGPKSGRHPHKSDAAAGRFCVEPTLQAIPTYFHFFRIKSIFTLDVNNHNG